MVIAVKIWEMSDKGAVQTECPFQAIAAMSLNRAIGKENRIPWHLSEDFQWFKSKTIGHVLVMGRKTFESLRRPLPNRRIIVLTRHPQKLINAHPGIFGKFREWCGEKKFHEWRGGKEVEGQLGSDFQFDFLRRLFVKAERQLDFQSRLFIPKMETRGGYNLLLLSSVNILTEFCYRFDRCVFVCGGAEVYRQLLPYCSDIFLTRVKREVDGDCFFPPFEDGFKRREIMWECEAFQIEHWRRRG